MNILGESLKREKPTEPKIVKLNDEQIKFFELFGLNVDEMQAMYDALYDKNSFCVKVYYLIQMRMPKERMASKESLCYFRQSQEDLERTLEEERTTEAILTIHGEPLMTLTLCDPMDKVYEEFQKKIEKYLDIIEQSFPFQFPNRTYHLVPEQPKTEQSLRARIKKLDQLIIGFDRKTLDQYFCHLARIINYLNHLLDISYCEFGDLKITDEENNPIPAISLLQDCLTEFELRDPNRNPERLKGQAVLSKRVNELR